MADYFDESCTYSDMYRCRYRMKILLFLRIVEFISNYDNYFIQRHNSAGKLGSTHIQKCTTSIRMLGYGVSADDCDEYVKIRESTAIECTRMFCKGVIVVFEKEYNILRRPSTEDLQRLLQVGEEHGFSRMIESIDCMHRQLKNCPNSWQGQFTCGHEGTSTVILEAIAPYDLWIWHTFFGLLDTLNDLNVLHSSPIFYDIAFRKAPYVDFTANGRLYNLAYYLADGIYPKYSLFV